MAINFFISYATADIDKAEWIANKLSNAGYTVWFARKNIRSGQSWPIELVKAMDSAERMIAVLSAKYLESDYTTQEYTTFMEDDPKGDKRLLIPVLIETLNVPRTLRSRQFIDLVNLPEDEAAEKLLNALQPGQPTIAPPEAGPAIPEQADDRERVIVRAPKRLRGFDASRICLKFDDDIAEVVVRFSFPPKTFIVRGKGQIGPLAFLYRFQPNDNRERTVEIRAAAKLDVPSGLVISCFDGSRLLHWEEIIIILLPPYPIPLAVLAATFVAVLLVAGIYFVATVSGRRAMYRFAGPADYFSGLNAPLAWLDKFVVEPESLPRHWMFSGAPWSESRGREGTGSMFIDRPGIAFAKGNLGNAAFYDFRLQIDFELLDGADEFVCALRVTPHDSGRRASSGYVFRLKRETGRLRIRGYACKQADNCEGNEARLLRILSATSDLQTNDCNDVYNSSITIEIAASANLFEAGGIVGPIFNPQPGPKCGVPRPLNPVRLIDDHPWNWYGSVALVAVPGKKARVKRVQVLPPPRPKGS